MIELCICIYVMLFIASSESRRWPSVGKYKVDIASFESLALPELQVSRVSLLLFIGCDSYFVYAFVNKIATSLS